MTETKKKPTEVKIKNPDEIERELRAFAEGKSIVHILLFSEGLEDGLDIRFKRGTPTVLQSIPTVDSTTRYGVKSAKDNASLSHDIVFRPENVKQIIFRENPGYRNLNIDIWI
ncbi:MAG: hypothetical protein WD335_00055 [Candidatus Paceibacterota bacterium]